MGDEPVVYEATVKNQFDDLDQVTILGPDAEQVRRELWVQYAKMDARCMQKYGCRHEMPFAECTAGHDASEWEPDYTAAELSELPPGLSQAEYEMLVVGQVVVVGRDG